MLLYKGTSGHINKHAHTHAHAHTHTLTHLIAGPAFEAVRVELVDVENMNGTLDAEMMQLARHFKE